MKLFVAACFLSVAVAHTSLLCTYTSPSNPGTFVVVIGNYHTVNDKINSDARALLGPASAAPDKSTFGPPCDLGDYILPSTSLAGTDARFKSKCSHIKYTSKTGTQKNYIYPDSQLSCYEADTGKVSTSQIQYLKASTRTPACFGTSKWDGARTIYMVAVEGHKSGTFSLKWHRPNYVLAGGGQRAPCKTISSKNNYLSIKIDDGKKSCTSSPPVPPGVDPQSIANCERTSGAICVGRCKNANEQRIGDLYCEDGKWVNTQMCSSDSVCLKPSGLSGVTNGPAGVVGKGCNTLTVAGTTCSLACDLYYAPKGHGTSSEGKIKCNAGAKGKYGDWSKVGSPQCELVKCPPGSSGTSIKAGCTCLGGYTGKVIVSGTYPYYTGGCTPLTKKPTTRPPTTKNPTTKKPTTKKPTTKAPTFKPVNCFKYTKSQCATEADCEWDEYRSTESCVPACWNVVDAGKCQSLKGCQFESSWGWCENKDHDKFIDQHKPKPDPQANKNKADAFLGYCGETSFCPKGVVTARECNVESGQTEAVCCENPTGLLKCLVKECVYAQTVKKCKSLDLHPSTCQISPPIPATTTL